MQPFVIFQEKSDIFSDSAPPSPAPQTQCHKISDDEEDEMIVSKTRKRPCPVFDDVDEDSDDSQPDTIILSQSTSSATTSSYKRLKTDLPEVVNKRGSEKALPHPFPLPANFRPEVELGLKTKMTAVARRHFLSAIASALFSYKR